MICRGILKNLSLDWITRKPEVTLQLEARAEDIEKLKDKPLSVEIKQYRKKRSLDANAYYWVMVGKLADKVGQSSPYIHNKMLRRCKYIEIIDNQGVYIVLPDTDEAQEIIDNSETYHLSPTTEVKPGKDGKMYRTYMMLRGSSTFNTQEMSRLIDELVLECKENDIETLPPDELERMMQAYGKKHIAK